jgi:hypothetical protein
VPYFRVWDAVVDGRELAPRVHVSTGNTAAPCAPKTLILSKYVSNHLHIDDLALRATTGGGLSLVCSAVGGAFDSMHYYLLDPRHHSPRPSPAIAWLRSAKSNHFNYEIDILVAGTVTIRVGVTASYWHDMFELLCFGVPNFGYELIFRRRKYSSTCFGDL